MQLSCSCSSPARENNFLLGFLIRRDRAGLLSHNDAGSLAQAVGHLLSYMNNFVGGCRELNDLS